MLSARTTRASLAATELTLCLLPDAAAAQPPQNWTLTREVSIGSVGGPTEYLFSYIKAILVLAARVMVPSGVTMMAARGEHVWGVQRDADDVPSVVRWRVIR